MLPVETKNKKQIALSQIELVKAEILSQLPKGVTSQEQDATAKEFLQTADEWFNEYKSHRLEVTRKFDELKKELMQPEKDFQEVITQLQAFRDEYANSVQKQMEIEGYSEEFETTLLASLKTLAIENKLRGIPAKQVDTYSIIKKPYQEHLQEPWKELCLEWQPKATSLYLKYYKEAPEAKEEAQEVKEQIQVAAQAEISVNKSKTLDYKPKGAREKREVKLTSAKAVGAVLRMYFNEKQGAVVEDKNLAFVAKYAATLPEEAIKDIEGVSIIKSIKTTKR